MPPEGTISCSSLRKSSAQKTSSRAPHLSLPCVNQHSIPVSYLFLHLKHTLLLLLLLLLLLILLYTRIRTHTYAHTLSIHLIWRLNITFAVTFSPMQQYSLFSI